MGSQRGRRELISLSSFEGNVGALSREIRVGPGGVGKICLDRFSKAVSKDDFRY